MTFFNRSVLSFLVVILCLVDCHGSRNILVTCNIEDGTIDVPLTQEFVITFSFPVNTSTVTPTSFFILTSNESDMSLTAADSSQNLAQTCHADDALAATIACPSNTVCTLTPDANLQPETEYTLCMSDAIQFQPQVTTFDGASFAFTTTTSSTDGFLVGGAVSGLNGELVLQNNLGDDLTLSVDGDFTFANALASGATYAVTIASEPEFQSCAVTNSSGTIADADIDDVTVVCSDNLFSIGGSVSGLAGTLILQNNEADDLTLSEDGDFTFNTPAVSGANYNVAVLSQPTSPHQSCVVTDGTGTIAGTNIDDVSVSCTTNRYAVGGSVSGLDGSVVLRINDGDDLSLSANGDYVFATTLLDDSDYTVTVITQPSSPSQVCTLAHATGTLDGAAITNVDVTCATNTYTVGGTVSGLSGSVTLQNNGGNSLVLSSNDDFNFTSPLADAANYNVTVSEQPEAQTCIVTNGSGTLSSTNVTNVTVTCSTNTYTVGGTVSGLSGSVTLQNNGGDNLTASSNGPLTFATPVATDATYEVAVFTQPSGQICNVSNGSGTMGSSNVTNVSVSCTGTTEPVVEFDDIKKISTDENFALAPTSDSEGAFSFTSSDPSVASVSGNTVTIHTTGTTTLTANQAADGIYTSGSDTALLSVYSNTCVLTEPCLHEGVCSNQIPVVAFGVQGQTDFTCECIAPYSGVYCDSSDVNCSEGSEGECLNGGSCQPTPAGGECECPVCYTGPQCNAFDPGCA